MEGIGKGIGEMFISILIIGIFFGAIIIWFFFSSNEIRSPQKIEPKIELIIENNIVDTIYIYEKP